MADPLQNPEDNSLPLLPRDEHLPSGAEGKDPAAKAPPERIFTPLKRGEIAFWDHGVEAEGKLETLPVHDALYSKRADQTSLFFGAVAGIILLLVAAWLIIENNKNSKHPAEPGAELVDSSSRGSSPTRNRDGLVDPTMSMSEQVRQMNERMDRIHQEIRDDARRRALSTLDGSSSPEAVMDPNPFITEVSQNEQQDQMSKKLEELHKELESKAEVKEVPKPINEESVIQPPKPLNMDNFNTTIELDSSVSKAVGSSSATPAGGQSPSR